MHDAISIIELIGDTPLVKLQRIVEADMASIYVKLESQNPAGSVKDRIAKSMVEGAEARGDLRPGMTIVEATSGNTGIGLAFIAAAKGYPCILAMPDSMTMERRRVVKAYGATLHLTPGSAGMPGAIAKAEEVSKEMGEDAWSPRQFENPDNASTHYERTGPELFQQLPEIDCFITGVGTGGTISGTGKFLKEVKPTVRVLAVEPLASPVLSGGEKGPHKIQGIGAGFIPDILDAASYDAVEKVSYYDAAMSARRLAQEEGILAGISSGASAAIALAEAKRLGPGHHVAFIICDYGERYASHEMFGPTPPIPEA